ncbi:MAG: ribonuclease J [Alphaproteobacteria bacterium]|nr:MAG: ribonuclease J [Alphaproteobacteria bacterium]
MAHPGFKMNPDAIYFVPLGGCGIFGANMTLYGHKGKWIMADCGMGFADDTMPGIDILLPDPAFAESLKDDLLGIVLTHAHEDHIGAITSLWPRLKVPLYATKFTAERIRQSLSEVSWGNQPQLNEVLAKGAVHLGPFGIQYIRMAHSIPEANALAITVKDVGTILHTGDWKIDRDPVAGNVTDENELKALGDAGVLAVVGDSTNAMVPGHSGSELTVQKNLIEIFGEFKNRIAISCFATNVARLQSIYEAARRSNRHVCLIGRSLWNIDEAARRSGYLKDVPPFLDDEQADTLPPGNVIYVCTGSQGEPRAALSRISNDDHPGLRLHEGDVVIFSSRAIPGNERAIDRIKNRFLAKGVSVITDRDAPVHVSGHPYREELKQIYGWLKPKIAIAVHGEHMQQEKHALLAKDCGAEQTVIPSNGQVFALSKSGAEEVAQVKSGILAIEGRRIVAIDHEAILMRRRIMYNGSVVVTVVVDDSGALIADPKVTAMGLLDDTGELDMEYMQDVVKEIALKIKNMPKNQRGDDEALSELVRITARRFFNERFDRKPQTRVHLVRV